MASGDEVLSGAIPDDASLNNTSPNTTFDKLIEHNKQTPSHWWYSNYDGRHHYFRNPDDTAPAPPPPPSPPKNNLCSIM